MEFNQLLKNEFVLLDGAMGTVLQLKGLEVGGLPELLGINEPELIIDIHKSYIKAGAQIIYANTFGANSYKMANCGYSVSDIISTSINNARKAANGTNTLVALDIGPIGQLLEPTGTLTFEQAYEIFKEQIIAGSQADVIVFETMTDLYEIKAGILAAKENSNLPILCTMTFEENLRTFTGCSISAMALTLEGLGVDAIGLNCSLGPREIYPIIEELTKWTNLPIIVKPNAGLPDPITQTYDVEPEEFALHMKEMVKLGVKIFGGCCGTTPEYISAVKNMLVNEKYILNVKDIGTAICSSLNTVEINQPRAIGERLNPTGRKRLKEALIMGNMDYVLSLALEQVEAGAEIINVNAGLPEIDEKDILVKMVKAIQSVIEVPLMIDSTIPEVIEAAARAYNGIPIINSVNGENKSIETILPIVKKYGACVTCLTLDENGIPQKSADRVNIARNIITKAELYGISKKNIIVDCLALTISSEQDTALETIKAINSIKTELNVKTVLGVSNISFGLPKRDMINVNYLSMALYAGLDLPIINVNEPQIIGCVRAYKTIAGYDKGALDYINHYKNVQSLSDKPKEKTNAKDIVYAIENGLKNEVAQITKELLIDKDPMVIINNILIPALDKIGVEYEKGEIFLPQLILAAGATQSAFEVLKNKMISENGAIISKGKIVLATVKGDVHDIGKNIVKILLENYGYTVIDLGKSVEYQTIVDAVKEHDVKLVGLSALMTSTLVSMKKTIELLRENNLQCEVVVGGAVLTPEYASSIGADYYAKDAKDTVDIAKSIFKDQK